jgi:hypothetical protein
VRAAQGSIQALPVRAHALPNPQRRLDSCEIV